MTLRAQIIIEKIDKLGFTKAKYFGVPEDTIKKVKDYTEWKKIFVKHVFGKGLV